MAKLRTPIINLYPADNFVRPVTDSRTVHASDGYQRVVSTYHFRTMCGCTWTIRVVIIMDDDSWCSYVIVPKDMMRWTHRFIASNGRHCIDWWDLFPQCFFASVGYGGPGTRFAQEPYLHKATRRFYVYCQTGGRDV